MKVDLQYGGGSLTSSSRTPSLSEVIQQHVRDALEQARVAMPGRVQSYDDSVGWAEVVPQLRRPFHLDSGLVQYSPLPNVISVPVVMPIAGGRRIKLPLAEGDIVLLVFCDFSIDDWKSGAGADDPFGRVTPRMYGSHQVADAIAIPGIFNPVEDSPHTAIEIRPDGKVLIGEGASHPLIYGDDFSDASLASAFGTLIKAIGTAVGSVPGAAAAVNAALVAYQTSVLAKLSGNKTS